MNLHELLLDPLRFIKLCWPDSVIYDKQAEILLSLRDNDETIVPAGNQLGKDYITAVGCLWFFSSRSPCRIVPSSSSETQLKDVLWGEMRRLLQTSRYNLPIYVTPSDMMGKQLTNSGFEARSYIHGIVTNVVETMQGHHLERGRDFLPRTLAVFDEASSIKDQYKTASETWAHRTLVIGNCLPCTNFFYRGVKGGDIKRDDGPGFHRKIIKIKAEDSPNVRLALTQQHKGIKPTGATLVPGVVDWPTYLKRRKLWTKPQQMVGLDAEFCESAEFFLYPPEWLNRAEEIADKVEREYMSISRKRIAKTMGIDTGEGGDDTAWCIMDEKGIMKMVVMSTPDTSVIPNITIGLIREFNLLPENVIFDRGGGGKQHADALRKRGYNVRTVGFGEPATNHIPEQANRKATRNERREEREEKYTYKNRRAEMYGLLRFNLLDPTLQELDEQSQWKRGGFGIPAEYSELRRQLSLMPLLYDAEGRLYLPPKTKKNKDSEEITLQEILGCSPDEADSLVLAVYGFFNKPIKKVLGAA